MTEYRKVFFDTAPIIYFLDKNDKYYQVVSSWMKEHAEAAFSSSPVTVMEYLAYPYRQKKENPIDEFNSFLSEFEIEISSIDEAVGKKAAEIRADHKAFRAMDALQLATACVTGCDAFVTNDKQLRQFSGLKIIVIEDLPDGKN